jgi:hypothetical protein
MTSPLSDGTVDGLHSTMPTKTQVNISKKRITTMEFFDISDSPDEKALKDRIDHPLFLDMDGSIYGIKNQTTIDLTGSSPDSAKSAPTTKKEVDDHSDFHHRITLYGSTIPYSPMVAQIPFVTDAKKGKVVKTSHQVKVKSKPKPMQLSYAKYIKQEPK